MLPMLSCSSFGMGTSLSLSFTFSLCLRTSYISVPTNVFKLLLWLGYFFVCLYFCIYQCLYVSSFVNLPLWLCVSLCLYLHPLVSLSVSVFVSYFWSMLLFEPFCTSFIHLPPSHSLFLPYWFCLNTHLSWCSYLWNELRLFVFRESSPQSASLSLYLSPSICTPDWLCLCCKMFHLTNLASKQAIAVNQMQNTICIVWIFSSK